MKTFKPVHVVKDYTDPDGDTILIDPWEDYSEWVPEEDTFEIKELVELHIPSNDDVMWMVNGHITDIVRDDGMVSPILSVKIKWETSAPIHESSQ